MKKKMLYVCIVVALVVLFLSQQQFIPVFCYALIAIALGAYILIIGLQAILKKPTAKVIITEIWSYILCGNMVCLPICRMYLSGAFTLFTIVTVINVATGLVYYLFSNDEEKAMRHFIMGLFYCTW